MILSRFYKDGISRPRSVTVLSLVWRWVGSGLLKLSMHSANGLGVVVFPQRVAGCQVDVVSSDKVSAMRQIVENLKNLGHDRIGFFGRCGEMPMVSDIFAGYVNAVSQLGLPFDIDWVVDIDRNHMLSVIDHPWWHKKIDQVEAIKKRDRVEAWVCCNDWPGYQLYRGMADRGYSIPHDISITGFDDNEPDNLGCPPLTSVKVPIKEICEAVLVRLMNESDPDHLKPDRDQSGL